MIAREDDLPTPPPPPAELTPWTFLAWHAFNPNGANTDEMSVFSNGTCGYWLGWWSPKDGVIWVQRGNGTNAPLDARYQSEVRWYAPLGNFIALTGQTPKK